KTDLNIGKWVNQPLSASLKSPVFFTLSTTLFRKIPCVPSEAVTTIYFFPFTSKFTLKLLSSFSFILSVFFTFIIYCILVDITKTTDLPFTKLIRKFYIPPLNKEYVIMNHTYNKRLNWFKGSGRVFEDLDFLQIIRITVDIAIVWYVFYKLIMIDRGTKLIQILKGILVVSFFCILSIVFNLLTIQWITNQAILWGFLVIIILFQPELRRALEQIGRGIIFSRGSRSEEDVMQQTAQSIVESCLYMAKRRIGALITLGLDTGAGEYDETGTAINGELTSQLLTNIFTPNTPLHDGAVIIKGNKIIAAACYLPLSESATISKELGTRHRAALGVSEVTDALTIIVSEETGAISFTKNGELTRDVDEKQLEDMLMKNLTQSIKNADTNLLNWRGKKNG